ncbi:hypothetical protein EX895_001801 [Sporisorium graminicola]|uniref:Uncharacterized protein n=1 Tax=Sporisorium graminicola TaxID=280036 RepID=A0A4U7KXH9_9BASI|nr:hypothetical protein EX895_001801 [Sporisorium graminicola]TKY89270.1 hypothetical protein EX895_001801 [Sporisorium graminicola]
MTDDNDGSGGDKMAAATRKQHRPFTQLASRLVQLIDDRFDEDQYDQAIELLEQLATDGIRPPKSLFQKLVALSLCSLAPGQVASTSRWTLDHQLHDIASRLLTQHKGSSKSDRNVTKAASTASDRPSPSAVLKASSLLIRYSRSSRDISAADVASQSDAEHSDALLARQILEALPSRRRPLPSSRTASPESPRRDEDSNSGDRSFEVSSIESWVRDDLRCADDVWDLLCHRRFSSGKKVADASLEQVSEFWMSGSERKRYQKQLQSCTDGQQRFEDRLDDIRWKKLKANQSSDSSDSSSDNDSDDDDSGPRLSMSRKRSTKTKSKRESASPAKPTKRVRLAAPPRDGNEAQQTNIKMTEGSWRTLHVLLRLWEQTTPNAGAASTGPGSTPEEDEPPLLWQFPRSHSSRLSGRPMSKRLTGLDTTDELDRALDVAFSFPSILSAYIPSSTGNGATANLFDTANAAETRGDSRPFSAVPEAELMHRQEVGERKEERLMAIRAETAAWLLSSIYRLAKLNYISSIAFTEGMSERMEALQAPEVQCLVLSLLQQQPGLVATVLARYLSDVSRTRPDKKRSPDPVHFRFDGHEEVKLEAALPYAMPSEEAASTLLRDCSMRSRDHDAKASLQYLLLNKLELEDSANSNLSLTFPGRAESRKQSVVHKQSRRNIKVESDACKTGKMKTKIEGGDVAAVVTEESKKDGLVAFAVVRAVQMEARDRMNQIKFLIARALMSMHTGSKSSQTEQGANVMPNGTTAVPGADQRDGQAVEADSKSQRQQVQLFLARLLKALKHDADDFGGCLSAMKTHVVKDIRRRKGVDDLLNSSRDARVALPSLESVVGRCQKCLESTQDLAGTTRLLLDSIKVL